MTEKSDDISAFPSFSAMLSQGMTLRDWFAGQIIGKFNQSYFWGMEPDGLAKRAYIIADAMLKEREK